MSYLGHSRKIITHEDKRLALEWLWLFPLDWAFYFLEKPKLSFLSATLDLVRPMRWLYSRTDEQKTGALSWVAPSAVAVQSIPLLQLLCKINIIAQSPYRLRLTRQKFRSAHHILRQSAHLRAVEGHHLHHRKAAVGKTADSDSGQDQGIFKNRRDDSNGSPITDGGCSLSGMSCAAWRKLGRNP